MSSNMKFIGLVNFDVEVDLVNGVQFSVLILNA